MQVNQRQKGHDLNVTGVWSQGITGKGVVVAILDDGLDLDHEDLRDNYVSKRLVKKPNLISFLSLLQALMTLMTTQMNQDLAFLMIHTEHDVLVKSRQPKVMCVAWE